MMLRFFFFFGTFFLYSINNHTPPVNLHCGIPGSATQVKMSSVKAYSRMLTHRYMCTHLRTGTHTHTHKQTPLTHTCTHTHTHRHLHHESYDMCMSRHSLSLSQCLACLIHAHLHDLLLHLRTVGSEMSLLHSRHAFGSN